MVTSSDVATQYEQPQYLATQGVLSVLVGGGVSVGATVAESTTFTRIAAGAASAVAEASPFLARAVAGPWGIAGAAAAGFVGGAIAGGVTAWMDGERDVNRITRAGLSTGMWDAAFAASGFGGGKWLAGIGRNAGGRGLARGLELAAAPGLTAFMHLQQAVPTIRRAIGAQFVPGSDKFALPTIELGSQRIPAQTFGQPDDSATPLIERDVEQFPPGMATMLCPWMKGHLPSGDPYPSRFYLTAQTEELHIGDAGVVGLLTNCYRSFGEGPPLPPESRKLTPPKMDELAKKMSGSFMQQYTQKLKDLTDSAQVWVHADKGLHELLAPKDSEANTHDSEATLAEVLQIAKTAVNATVATISKHAPVVPTYPETVKNPKDLQVLDYLHEAVAAGANTLETTRKRIEALQHKVVATTPQASAAVTTAAYQPPPTAPATLEG